MKVYNVCDSEFKKFGRIIDLDFSPLLSILNLKECPEITVYFPSDNELENTKLKNEIELNLFGGMEIQIGYCNGYNDKLNCLEYHISSEINIVESDTILLLGSREDIINNTYNTNNVKAFLVPKGMGVELYATTLHYAPCGKNGSGFRVAIILPKFTNFEKPLECDDPLLFKKNKWLLAHEDSQEAKSGAVIGLIGENLKV